MATSGEGTRALFGGGGGGDVRIQSAGLSASLLDRLWEHKTGTILQMVCCIIVVV